MQSIHDKLVWGLISFSCTYTQRIYMLINLKLYEFPNCIFQSQWNIRRANWSLVCDQIYKKNAHTTCGVMSLFVSQTIAH